MKAYLLLLIATLLIQASSAQDLPQKKDSIYSAILQEQRSLQVILPSNYNPSQVYDVLYVIDGEWNTLTFYNIRRYLQAVGFAPPAIIVGVPNTYKDDINMRDRDFLPTQVKNTPFSGGAANFLSFFKTELIPYINKTYHPGGESILFGASFGGTFVMYALLTDPDVFKAYLCSDPAFWWDNRYLVKLAGEKLPQAKLNARMLFIGGRAGKAAESMGIAAMDSVLRATKPAGLAWKVSGYEGETHNSVTFKTNYDALKFTYGGYTKNMQLFGIHGGIVLPEKPITISLYAENLDIRYTNDSTLPAKEWIPVDTRLVVTNPDHMTVRSFSPSGRYTANIPLHLRSGTTLAPAKKKPAPLHFAYFDLTAKNRKPVKTGHVDATFQLKEAGLPSFECLVEGALTIPDKSYYVLQLDDGEGSEVYINDTLRVKQPVGVKRQSIILPLDKGVYALKIKLIQAASQPLPRFFVFKSTDGQDEWWNNVIFKL
ncbi:alpha/beta hydrolase [Chitinophaga niabensis]|uniref:Predicted hydrolase of the alpha/beta superfamily n=1 Tax=Chitinophaga niabensis TaxID=536979 RepID=A0A1N6DIJ2_9BACT|nr:alpha/beta hydrolase-fold protein [Chitinophaga niabensis]SIN70602.1 Predicted hydrolase of the alpha/beta superfamily [Chitinophaga niabensis]